MEISVRESLEKKGKQKYNIITMIYFVTEQYLKLNVPITNNVDDTDFVPLIKSAADQYVRSILGTYFYNYLLQEYNNQTLSATEITLVQDYIQYSVAWRVASETAITVSYQLKNKGLQKQSGDYSQAVDMSEIAFMSHHYRDRADFYDQRLIKNARITYRMTDGGRDWSAWGMGPESYRGQDMTHTLTEWLEKFPD